MSVDETDLCWLDLYAQDQPLSNFCCKTYSHLFEPFSLDTELGYLAAQSRRFQEIIELPHFAADLLAAANSV